MSLIIGQFSIRKIYSINRVVLFGASLFLAMALTSQQAEAQDLRYGITGGLNITTINSSNDSGLKLGFNIGGTVKYSIDEQNRIKANLIFSTAGQQYSKEIDNRGSQWKNYYSTSLYYITIPIVYQYYFPDILGLEIGPRFGYCLIGTSKTKEGNESWKKEKLSASQYNPFEVGIVAGVFTCNFANSGNDNVIIGLRGFYGFTNVLKDSGHNVNLGIQISIGYIFDNH